MAFSDVVTTLAPIAWYRHAETSGTTMVDEMGAYDGTYAFPPTFGEPGITTDGDTAVKFDQETYGTMPLPAFTAFTFVAVVALAYDVDYSPIFWEGNATHSEFSHHSAGVTNYLNTGTDANYSDTAAPLTDGQSILFVAHWDGAQVSVGIDGTWIKSQPVAGSIVAGDWLLGCAWFGGFMTRGVFDETLIFDRALTDPEIASLAAEVVAGDPPTPPTVYTQEDPLVLTGTSGTFEVDFTAASEAWVAYTPTTSGSLVMTVTDPAGWLPQFTVYDDEDVEMQHDEDGELGLVWTLDELMQIRIAPGPEEPTPSAVVTFEWTYADRASSPLIVTADAEVLLTPGAMNVTISNGIPNDTVTFSLIGPSASADFQTITLDDTGQAEDVAVYLPGLAAGSYLLRTEGVESGSEDTDFDVLEDALSFENTGLKPAPTPPVTDLAQHWRFFDLRDPEVTYTMQRNPRSWTNVYPPNDFTHEKVTAPDGQAITWEAARRPWRMEFTGYLDTQEEYDALAFWSALRRRFWLVDHRNRAWLVTFEQFDAQARIVPNVPWAHNYTVKAVMFMQGTMG